MSGKSPDSIDRVYQFRTCPVRNETGDSALMVQGRRPRTTENGFLMLKASHVYRTLFCRYSSTLKVSHIVV